VELVKHEHLVKETESMQIEAKFHQNTQKLTFIEYKTRAVIIGSQQK
jgi:hypothetical protein